MADDRNVVLIGMPGSGKTTVGKMVAQKLGYDFIDTDDTIVKRYGDIPELFKKGEDYFRQCETACLLDEAKRERTVIATGGGSVVRMENMTALSETGTVFFLNRSVKNIISDIVSETRPLLSEGKDKLYTLYDTRIELYKKYADVIIDSDQDIDKVVCDITDKVKGI